MRNSYSVIATITANDTNSVADSLKQLAIELRIKIPNQNENLCEQLCTHIEKFLNHHGYSYLFFVDNVIEIDDQISLVLNLKNTVKGLHIILATVNSNIHKFYNWEPLVEFNGMENNEILQLFKSEPPVKVSNNQIEDLITVIGNIPLVVYVAKQYILRHNHTVEKYIETFNKFTGEYALEKFKAHAMFDQRIIQSQLLPLKEIEKLLHKKKLGDLWDLVGYLPYLQYRSVSNEVLEACYYHSCQTKYNQPLGKLRIETLTNQFSTFSIHHSENIPVRRMSDKPTNDKPITDKPITECKSPDNSFLTFHELTMSVLDLIENENDEDEKRKELKKQSRAYFLLKMFCFEIDIDARTDVTLDRNMQFLPHAEKLLNELVLPDEKKDSLEVKFYLSYLNCAIGSTLLYQRNDVELAHKYLLKSRSLCLELVMNKTDLFVINPPTENDVQHILDASFSPKFDSNFVLEFVKNKRRSESEKDVICEEIGDLNLFHKDKKESFKYHYLKDNSLYEKLLKNNIALPAKDISETFLYELLQRILHNNSRAWNELRYITTDDTTETFRKASHSEVVFSNSLCRLRKRNYTCQNMFVCLESDRSGRMLECWTRDSNLFNEVDEDISFYKTMIREKSNNYFDFGILKLSPRVNDRHIAMCRRILLWFLERKFSNQENENAETTFEDGKTVLEELQNQIKQMQTIKYTWLPLPLLHIQCAKFLRLSSITSDISKAEHLFRKAISLEESRGVSWSRFMWEGYVGALACVKKSNKQFKENEIIKEVREKLTGTNRKELIEKLTATNTF